MDYALLSIYVTFAFVTDARKSIIPNFLTIAACIMGVVLHGSISGWDGVALSLLGLSCGFGLMFPLYACKAIGAGDVKLFAGIGALTGVPFVINSMVYSVIFAGVIGFAILLWRKELGARILKLGRMLWCMLLMRDYRVLSERDQSGSVTFPFMYAVAPAVLMTFAETVF